MRFPVLLALLTACATEAPPPPVPGTADIDGEVLLTVDGRPLHTKVIDLALKEAPPQQIEMMRSSGQLKGMVEGMALGEVLYNRAIEQGLHNDADTQLALAIAARNVLAQALVDQTAEGKITDQAIQDAYEKRKVQYAKPSAKVRHIILTDASKKDEVWGLLQGGADFAEMAKTHSADRATGENGGELGWVVKGQLAPDVSAKVFANENTGLVEPIETGGAVLLVEVLERRSVTPLEDVREELKAVLKGEAAKAFISEVEGEITIEWKADPNTIGSSEG